MCVAAAGAAAVCHVWQWQGLTHVRRAHRGRRHAGSLDLLLRDRAQVCVRRGPVVNGVRKGVTVPGSGGGGNDICSDTVCARTACPAQRKKSRAGITTTTRTTPPRSGPSVSTIKCAAFVSFVVWSHPTHLLLDFLGAARLLLRLGITWGVEGQLLDQVIELLGAVMGAVAGWWPCHERRVCGARRPHGR